jgi:hypothetical protein
MSSAFLVSLGSLLTPLVVAAATFKDPGLEFAKCVDQGTELDTCSENTMNGIRPIMSIGIPELDPPVLPMDPMAVDKIPFTFATVQLEFLDLDIRGFQKFDLRKSQVDKDTRKWNVVMFVPELKVAGRYNLEGDFFGVDLGRSEGPETFNASEVLIDVTAHLEDNNGKIHISKVDLLPKFSKIKIEMFCLFPNFETKKCCEDKWRQSCSPTLAKTIHKFVNKDGEKFVEQFLPEISEKFGAIIQDLLNSALQNLESRYLIN